MLAACPYKYLFTLIKELERENNKLNVQLRTLRMEHSIEVGQTKRCNVVRANSKDLPNMNAFCDWLSETIVFSVYDSFFRNYISIDLLSFIVLNSQSQRLFI